MENREIEVTPVDTQSNHESGYSDVAGSPKKELIEAALAQAMATGEKPNLSAIARETGCSYSYVKKCADQMKKERTTDGMPALQIVKR